MLVKEHLQKKKLLNLYNKLSKLIRLVVAIVHIYVYKLREKNTKLI